MLLNWTSIIKQRTAGLKGTDFIFTRTRSMGQQDQLVTSKTTSVDMSRRDGELLTSRNNLPSFPIMPLGYWKFARESNEAPAYITAMNQKEKSESPEALKEENKRLKMPWTCKLCNQKRSTVVLLPCALNVHTVSQNVRFVKKLFQNAFVFITDPH